MCPLVMNVYGHPRAGKGGNGIPEWPSVFWHLDNEVLLGVYVYDLLASGEEKATRGLLSDLAKKHSSHKGRHGFELMKAWTQ